MLNYCSESTEGIEKVSQLRGGEEVEVTERNSHAFCLTKGQSQKKH